MQQAEDRSTASYAKTAAFHTVGIYDKRKAGDIMQDTKHENSKFQMQFCTYRFGWCIDVLCFFYIAVEIHKNVIIKYIMHLVLRTRISIGIGTGRLKSITNKESSVSKFLLIQVGSDKKFKEETKYEDTHFWKQESNIDSQYQSITCDEISIQMHGNFWKANTYDTDSLTMYSA